MSFKPLRVLCIDDGLVNTLSSLFLLRSFVHPSSRAWRPMQLDPPCKVFDVIAGSGTGGLVALLLGRLEMPIDEVISFFSQVCRAGFQDTGTRFPTRAGRTRNIEKLLKNIVREKTGSEDCRMFNPYGCRTFIIASPGRVVDPGFPTLLCTYESLTNQYIDCTIVQVARAALATPELFDPIKIATSLTSTERFANASTGLHNPVRQVLRELRSSFPGRRIGLFLSLGAGQFSPTESAATTSLEQAYKLRAWDCEETAQRFESSTQRKDLSGAYYRLNFEGIHLPHRDFAKTRNQIITDTLRYITHGSQWSGFDLCSQMIDTLTALSKTGDHSRYYVNTRLETAIVIADEVRDLTSGAVLASISCSRRGVWNVLPTDADPFLVAFSNPSIWRVITSKTPWDHPEWNSNILIQILIEIVYLEGRLCQQDDIQSEFLQCIRRIVRQFETFPSSLYFHEISKVGMSLKGGGGYADIYQGRINNGKNVCLKILRMYESSNMKKLFKDFSQEVLVWSQLKHPNVLPFLGINTKTFFPSFCLVSPWYDNGDVMNYLSTHPETDKIPFIWDVIDGLKYLHTRCPIIVHGDLKGVNILVSDEGRCCLADFGLSKIIGALQTISTSTSGIQGSVRWMAPELFNDSKLSAATDIYALGCTILEMITGKHPFPEISNNLAVIVQVTKGERPSRPAVGFSDGLWSAVSRCLVDRQTRPMIEEFVDLCLEVDELRLYRLRRNGLFVDLAKQLRRP